MRKIHFLVILSMAFTFNSAFGSQFPQKGTPLNFGIWSKLKPSIGAVNHSLFHATYFYSFEEYADAFIDDLDAAGETIDATIAEESQSDFLEYLFENGIESTASAYDVDAGKVSDIVDKFYSSYVKFCDLAIFMFGEVEQISVSQYETLVDSIGSYVYNSVTAPWGVGGLFGPCETALDNCIGAATDDWYGGIIECNIAGLGIAMAGFPGFGLILGLACHISNSNKFRRAKQRCNNTYDDCKIALD